MERNGRYSGCSLRPWECRYCLKTDWSDTIRISHRRTRVWECLLPKCWPNRHSKRRGRVAIKEMDAELPYDALITITETFWNTQRVMDTLADTMCPVWWPITACHKSVTAAILARCWLQLLGYPWINGTWSDAAVGLYLWQATTILIWNSKFRVLYRCREFRTRKTRGSSQRFHPAFCGEGVFRSHPSAADEPQLCSQ